MVDDQRHSAEQLSDERRSAKELSAMQHSARDARVATASTGLGRRA